MKVPYMYQVTNNRQNKLQELHQILKR